MGARYKETGLKYAGYDHNFVLNHGGKRLDLAARVEEPKSGRVLEVLTTEPGVQFYTANGLDGSITGAGGVPYPRFGGFCSRRNTSPTRSTTELPVRGASSPRDIPEHNRFQILSQIMRRRLDPADCVGP